MKLINKKRNLKVSAPIIFIILSCLALLFYGQIFNTWFQQDEWLMIGKFAYLNSQSKIFLERSFFWNFIPNPTYAFYPLADYFFAFLVKIFKLNFDGYAIASLFLLSINSFLLYKVVLRLTGKNKLALLSSILFATSGIGQKAITWVIASTNTQSALFFSLLTILAFDKFVQKGGWKKLFVSIFLFFLALLSKETAVVLFLVLPLYSFFNLVRSENNARAKTGIFAVITFFLLYGLFRYFLITKGIQLNPHAAFLTRALNLKEYMLLILWSPVRSVVGVFISPDILYKLGKLSTVIFFPKYRYLQNTTAFGQFSETTGVDLVNLILFIPISSIVYIAYRLIPRKDNGVKQVYFMALAAIFSSILISLMLSIRGVNAILQIPRSRDLYLPSIGSSVILSILFIYLYGRLKARIGKILLIFAFLLLTLHNFSFINKFVLYPEVQKASARKSIVQKIDDSYPLIPKKVIFYTESDTSYYGSSVPSMPFQTGFGRTLLVWYALKYNDRPLSFMQDEFLYLARDQDYREINGYGFGYFTDLAKLKKTIKEFNLSPNSIIAFAYYGKTNSLKDITLEIRKKIE